GALPGRRVPRHPRVPGPGNPGQPAAQRRGGRPDQRRGGAGPEPGVRADGGRHLQGGRPMSAATAPVRRTAGPGGGPAGRRSARAAERAEGWRRRAPLLPALVFTLAVTQLPFLATVV